MNGYLDAFSSATPQALAAVLTPLRGQPVGILCAGTDRWTGDALGPLTGHFLQQCNLPAELYGTLEHPLRDEDIPARSADLRYKKKTILLIDACLDNAQHVHQIHIQTSPDKASEYEQPPQQNATPPSMGGARRSNIIYSLLFHDRASTDTPEFRSFSPTPLGSAVGKRINVDADIVLLGIVNIAGFMQQQVLQNTRLHHVYRMAECIAAGVALALGSQGLCDDRVACVNGQLLSH